MSINMTSIATGRTEMDLTVPSLTPPPSVVGNIVSVATGTTGELRYRGGGGGRGQRKESSSVTDGEGRQEVVREVGGAEEVG